MRTERQGFRADVRAVAWWVLAGASAGAIAGFLLGGVGGRLAMLLLRLTSPEYVIGIRSDDGFEIGAFSGDSLFLLGFATMLGAANGVLYAAVRGALAPRLRLPLWTLLAATGGGASFVHADGVDFTLLEPAALAVGLFVALPAIAAGLVVVLAERWVEQPPFPRRGLSAGVVVTAAAGTFALAPAIAVAAVALVVRRVSAARVLMPVGRVVVPAAIAVAIVVTGVDLGREAIAIL